MRVPVGGAPKNSAPGMKTSTVGFGGFLASTGSRIGWQYLGRGEKRYADAGSELEEQKEQAADGRADHFVAFDYDKNEEYEFEHKKGPVGYTPDY